MKTFWEKLPKTFFCLAPMADVTDSAFRRIITKYGKPDVMWTEFVSADGLSSVGRDVLKNNLVFSKKEKPIVAQLFSANPDRMRQASKYVALLGFDGIDINMGCPDRSVEKQGAGAAMMKDMKKAGEIIQAVKNEIKESRKKVSISVKTRVGYNKNQIEEWIPFLLSQNIDALTIHARTRKEMSDVPANWDHVKRVVEIRNQMKVKTKIIGNGDVKNIEEGRKLAEETGCDGIMIGRAIFGNPWLFADLKFFHSKRSLSGLRKINSKFSQILGRGGREPVPDHSKTLINFTPTTKEKLKVMLEHTKLFEKLLGKHKNFAVMKKHFKAYANGFTGAKELRVELMETNNSKEVEVIINKFLKNH